MKKNLLFLTLFLLGVGISWAQNEAKVGSIEYPTLGAAITNAAAGETVTLLTDVNLAASQTIDKNLTLDLAGKTISGSVQNLINITAGDVTITNGTITSTANSMIKQAGTGTVNLTNCELSGSARTVHISSSGTVNANNSVITSTGNGTVYNQNGTFNATGSTVSCNGATASFITLWNNKSMFLDNCTLSGPSVVVYHGSSETLDIKDCEIESKTYTTSGALGVGTIVNNTGIVNIYGSTQIKAYCVAIQQSVTYNTPGIVNFGGYKDNSNLVAAGAPSIIIKDTNVMNSAHPYAISTYYDGTVNIFGDATITNNGSLVTAAVGCTNGGTVNFTGGNIEGFEMGFYARKYSSPETIYTCHINVSDSANMEITGTSCVERVGDHPTEISISGGTFNVDVPELLCAPGYFPFDNGDGTYTVSRYSVMYHSNTSDDLRFGVRLEHDFPVTVTLNAPMGIAPTAGAALAWNTKSDGSGDWYAEGSVQVLNDTLHLYAQDVMVYNATQNIYYTGLQAAINDATAGDSLVVLTDLTMTATISINKSLTINGNKKVIKTTKDRGLWFDAGKVTLNLKNFYFDGTGMPYNSSRGIRALQVDKDTVTLNMDSCRIYNVQEYPLYAFRDVVAAQVTVTNSYIQGLTALRSYASDSYFTFENDTLYGINPCTNNINYATIYLDGNNELTLSQDNAVSIEKCVIISEVSGICDPQWLGIAFSASGNEVYVDADTKIIDGAEQDITSELSLWLGGGKNYVFMPLTSSQKDMMEYNDYTLTELSDGTVIVSAPVYWQGTNVTTVLDGFDEMFIDFHAPFLLGLLETGDTLTLDDDITLKETVFPGGINFMLKLNGYDIEPGTNCILLDVSDTVTTDTEVEIFCADEGGVMHIDNGDGTYTYFVSLVLNANTGVGYGDLQAAIDDATAGDSLVVLADLSQSVYINVNKSIIIHGNNHTITSDASRGMRITSGNVNVTLRNLDLECSLAHFDQDYRGVSLDANISNVKLTMDSCRVLASDYALNCAGNSNGHEITVSNSYIQGWAALNSFAQNSTFTFVNDTLYGINNGNCSGNHWMDFATISIDGGSLLGVTGSTSSTLDIQNSVIIAKENTDCVQKWISIQYGASICNVSVDGTTKIIDGNGNDVTSKLYVDGAKSNIALPLTSEEKDALAAQYYTLTDNSDGSTKVSHSIRYKSTLYSDPIYTDFHYPFTTNNLSAGDSIELLEDVTMTQEVYSPITGNFTIVFKDGSETHSISQGSYSIVLDDDQTCTTDKQVLDLFTSLSGSSIKETDNSDGTWTYSVTPYYTVTYDANDGTGIFDAQTKPEGTPITLLDGTALTKTDSTLYRWNTTPDEAVGSTNYALGAEYTDDADLDLYAVWRLNLDMTMDSTDVVCYGENNGADTVRIIGGEEPFQLVLSGTVLSENDTVKNIMDRTYIFENLKPGSYTITLTDVLGKDTITGTFSITQPDTLMVTGFIVPEKPCPLMGTGVYDVVMMTTGGNGDNHYVWSDAAVNVDDSITTVIPGDDDRDSTYTVTVTVTDKKGCNATSSTTFSVSPVIADDGTVHANSKLTTNPDTIKVGIYQGCDTIIRNFGTYVFTSTNPAIDENILDTVYNDIPVNYPDSIFPVGYSTIIWTAVDTCGHEVTAEQIVYIYHYPCPTNITLDGYTYQSARVGCTCWLNENLRAENYSDGRPIENVMTYVSDMYPDEAENLSIYGHLYDWYAAADTATNSIADIEANYALGKHIQGICPDGWSLPNDEEFEELQRENTRDLRSTEHWINAGLPGTNATGFNAVPGGWYNCTTGRFESLGGGSYYWSCHPVYDLATGAMIDYVCERVQNPTEFTRCSGLSVRCVLVFEE